MDKHQTLEERVAILEEELRQRDEKEAENEKQVDEKEQKIDNLVDQIDSKGPKSFGQHSRIGHIEKRLDVIEAGGRVGGSAFNISAKRNSGANLSEIS